MHERDEPVITDRLHPDWDGKKLFRAARDKARATLGREHPISGLLAHAAYDYDTDRWFEWRLPVALNVGRIAEMLIAGDLLPAPRNDDTTVERLAHAMARANWEQMHENGEEWDEREHWAVPRLLFEAQARAALAALTNPNPEEENRA